MKRIAVSMMSFLIACSTLAADNLDAEAQAVVAQRNATRDARMEWWRDAKFGMFIHWNVSSVPGGIYKGKQVPGVGEWIMNKGQIPVAEYREFAKQFNPQKFNADQWVKVMKDAGMKYIVITAKHHDGFAMYHSSVSNWNIYDATPFKPSREIDKKDSRTPMMALWTITLKPAE